MKVAVCISGQMRTFDQTIKNLKMHLLDKYDCDIFLHTWEDKGITTDVNRLFPKGMQSYFSKEIENDSSLFMDKYKLIFDDIIDTNKFTKKDVGLYPNVKAFKIEKIPENYEKDKELFSVKYPDYLQKMYPRRFHNLSLFYKIYKCNELKCNYEKEHGFTYDAVVKIRPDVNLLSDIVIPNHIQEKSIYVKGEMRNENYIHDQSFFSSSETMDLIASLWSNLNEYWNPEFRIDWKYENRTIGDLLYFHANNNDIKKIDVKYKSTLANLQDQKKPMFDSFKKRLSNYLNNVNSIDINFFNAINSAIAENALNFYDLNKDKCFALLNKYYIIGNYCFSHPPYGLGCYYLKAKEYSKAVNNLCIAYKIESQNYKIFKLYSEALFLNDDFVTLKKVLDDAVNKVFYKDNLPFFINYYRKINENSSVINIYNSNDLACLSDKSLYQIGLTLYGINSLEKAINVFKHILKTSDSNTLLINSSYKIAQALNKLGHIEEAHKYLDDAILGQKDNFAYTLFKSQLFRKELKFKDALAFMTVNEINFDTDNMEKFYYEVATIYMKIKDYKKALVYLYYLNKNYKNVSKMFEEISKSILME